MPEYASPALTSFGLLPDPERNPASVVTSAVVNGLILALLLYVGVAAKKTLEQRHYEQTLLILPAKPPETPALKVKMPPPPKVETPKLPELKLEPPKIALPRIEPKPEPKPVQLESKVQAPVLRAGKPAVVLAPQPKSALSAAAMPAQSNNVRPSTAPVHFGQTFGVTPNPNATRPATVAAIGNPYGGSQGPAVAPHGVVGSTGFGNGLKSGSNAGVVGRVASAGIPGGRGQSPVAAGPQRVASTGIPALTAAAVAPRTTNATVSATNLEVLSKPAVQYTSEARQLHVQGDVILRVTFTASGRVVVQGVVRGLGHGLDEEARRVAQQIRFRPATRNGQAVDLTTNITITFQLA